MIEFHDVHKSFGSLDVLKGINLKIEKSQVVTLIGPSGSGKSTILRCMNLLERPTSGQVLIEGQDITAPKTDIQKIRKDIGMVFQHFNLFPHMTVMENMVYAPIRVNKMPKDQAKEKALELLKLVGLTEKADVYPGKLSGGQKQRIAIAGILAMEPEILIMDEATAMLDPKGRAEVLDTVKRLNREKGITVVYITHFMEETVEADRIVVMGDGTIQMTGTPQEVFAREEELDSLTLEVPEVTKIARELQSRGIAVDRNILTLEELAEALCQFI